MEPRLLRMDGKPSSFRTAAHVAIVLSVAIHGFLVYKFIRNSTGAPFQPLDSTGPPAQRSAELAFGEDFAHYISFVSSYVPEGGIVALPPGTQHQVLGHTGLMQYFLFPRRTTNCPSGQPAQACAAQIKGPDVFVLKVGSFPDPGIEAELNKEYVPFNDRWGLYLPTGGDAER